MSEDTIINFSIVGVILLLIIGRWIYVTGYNKGQRDARTIHYENSLPKLQNPPPRLEQDVYAEHIEAIRRTTAKACISKAAALQYLNDAGIELEPDRRTSNDIY